MAERREGPRPTREERPARALLVVFLVAIACATLVSATAVLLEPLREANRAAEREGFLAGLVEGLPGMGELLAGDSGRLEARVVELGTEQESPADAAAIARLRREDPDAVEIPRSLDLARLRSRPARELVYLLQGEDGPRLIVLPISGRGYGGLMRGYLALDGEAERVVALTVTEHEETPGFGARVGEAEWLAQWSGKRLRGPEGELAIRVAEGPVDEGSAAARHEVDAITGATRTSRAVTHMLHYWLGEHGFGPYLDRLRAGGGER